MSTIVGPFTVEDANLLGQAQAVAALIPPAIAEADRPGQHHVWSSRRFGAPDWSFGYTPNSTNSWCNPRRHVVAHEYFHGWWARHGRSVGGNSALRKLVDHPELIGKTETGSWTNRLSEAAAHGFSAAIGAPDGVQSSFFRVKIPPSNYAALLALLSKAVGEETRPTHIYRRSQRGALRQLPRVDSPALGWAESGDVIRAEVGLSGGPYEVPTALGDGLPSLLWLVVSALNGHPVWEPMYTAALLWVPIPAESLTP